MLKSGVKTLEILLESMPATKVVGISGRFIPIDLSAENPDFDGLTATDFEAAIDALLRSNHAVGAFGGYDEKRSLYGRSAIFKNEAAERIIHIGIDLWTKAKTPVLAALDGKIHSLGNNRGLGNYGPTIILEHKIAELAFFTLYGHLSRDSIAKISIGAAVRQGEQIGTLGDATVNGDYAPHLHFQVIENIGGYFGDYPGVCSQADRAYYLGNCPDPNLLLKLK